MRTSSATSIACAISGRSRPNEALTPAQLALAWLLNQGQDIVAIPGSRTRHRLEENCAAADVTLSKEDLKRIDEIAPPGAFAGQRYADMSSVNL